MIACSEHGWRQSRSVVPPMTMISMKREAACGAEGERVLAARQVMDRAEAHGGLYLLAAPP
jgi:hypothetical protein